MDVCISGSVESHIVHYIIYFQYLWYEAIMWLNVNFSNNFVIDWVC